MIVYFEDQDDAKEAAYRLEFKTGVTVRVLQSTSGKWFLTTSELSDSQLMDNCNEIYLGAKF